MRLSTKFTLASAVFSALLILVLVSISLLSFRHYSILTAKAHAETAAEVIRVGLTESMINGTIDKRGNFLDRLTEIQGLKTARIIRGPAVIRQFGPGTAQEQASDLIDSTVLATGQPYFEVLGEGAQPLFRSTIPYTATSQGNPNCLSCHQVAEGTVLGAVTLTLSIPHLKQYALMTITFIVLSVTIMAVISILVMRRASRSIVHTANEVQAAVEQAVQGNFTNRIESRTDDEIGQIGRDLNHLLRFLHSGLDNIRQHIAELIQCKTSDNVNLLNNTISMVEGLIDAAQFKQAIEEDESTVEVYNRLARILDDEFRIEHFSIYEVNGEKNTITPVVVDGETGAECRWCDPQILLRADGCRTFRTGHLIDGIESPFICSAFKPGSEHRELNHICVPVIQSGSVGSVVQLIAAPGDTIRIQDSLTFLNVYLREAAPVIEAKRLMDTLRETTLRDPMTGLHNRRFLEEYIETLTASADRRESSLCIMMLDLDYFKQVNDNHGHDAGDMILKNLAKTFRASVRTSDLVIRYGGEEFMIILQDTAENTCLDLAEKIRSDVEQQAFQLSNAVINKTLSIGLANYPHDSDSIWQVVKYADVALFKAKGLGRNRVIRFEPSMRSDEESLPPSSPH